jgi:catechol 2,3-dioxygenase-like lactoylglutathione lyase family enzyme
MTTILQNHYVLAVRDVRKSAAFYVSALGFAIVAEPEGWIFVRKDQCLIMLGECPDDLPASELGCHSYVAYLRVDDADAYYSAIQSSGLALAISPVTTEPWGMREFGLTTPDGHRLKIGHIASR